MKQSLLHAFMLFCSLQLNAQIENIPTREMQPLHLKPSYGFESKNLDDVLKLGGDLLWQDDFSNAANWTIGTTGQGTFIIGDNTHPEMVGNGSMYLGSMASTTAANGFAFFNGIQYGLAEIADPQNSTVTSNPIDLTGIPLIILSFEQRYRAFNYDQTFVEASLDGGVTWSFSEEVNTALEVNALSVQNTVTVHIPTNGSANTLIRFRWYNTSDDNQFGSGYGWCVDDVEIREGYGNDIALHSVFATVGGIKIPVTKIPLSQVAGGAEKIQFKSFFENNGYNSLPVSMNVTGSGYNFETAPVTVNSLNRDSLQINDANGMTIPAVIGSAGIMTTLLSSASLSNTSDDSAPVLFDVTENIYAVDAYDGTVGSFDGYFTSWSGSNGDVSIGNQFEIYADIEGGSIGIGIADIPVAEQSTYIGREFFGLIYVFNPATGDFEYYNETNVKALEASDFGSVVYLNMNGFTLPTGRYLIMAASYALNYVPFAFSGSVPNQSVYGMDMGSLVSLGGASYPNTIKAPVVRINTELCTVQETLTINTCVSYTSPSGNYTWTTSGTYADTVTMNGTCDTIFTINLTIGSQPAPVVTTYVQPSDDNGCVGTVAINIVGTPNFTCEIDGAAPFTNSGYGLVDMLCGGVHVLDITDACGTLVIHTFIVPVDSNYIYNNSFIDSIAVDSLGAIIEDCDIDYNSIDTAYIDSIFANGNEVTVIWNIVDSNGSNFDTSSYVLNNGNGVYYLQLSVFCPTRAIGDYFGVSEAIYFVNGSVSTAGINDTGQLPWVEIFPNPTSGLVTINTGSTSTKLEVVDAQGRIVLTEVGFQQKTISLEMFRAGIYFFHLSSDKGTLVARVLKR
jgi:Secretion system C-terminal sorting domain